MLIAVLSHRLVWNLLVFYFMHNIVLKNTPLFKRNLFKFAAFYSFIHLTILDIGKSMVRKNIYNPFSFGAYSFEGE